MAELELTTRKVTTVEGAVLTLSIVELRALHTVLGKSCRSWHDNELEAEAGFKLYQLVDRNILRTEEEVGEDNA